MQSIISLIGVALSSIAISVSTASSGPLNVTKYSTSSLPSTIDLNDCNDETIRDYYSSLNSLDESERKGANLLKNLKPILKNGQKYYSYDGSGLWKMYEITDRDWTKSPATDLTYGTYDPTTNKITGYKYGSSRTDAKNNPYLHALYFDRSVDNQLRAWTNDGGTTVSHGDNKEWCIDQEHIWPKSQGFNASGSGGARGDPMHLWPGDSDVNSSLHNDQFYGYVDVSDAGTKTGKWSYAKDNYVGKSLTLGTTLSSEKVFEPQDSDKGDIARAIFYLVARYNYLSGEDGDGIDSNNPNLELVQSNETVSGYTSSTTNTGKMGILTDLLAWHHLDPVDEFEVHRNNLLYNNFTNNRNPFIDFPDWVDYIWGTAEYEGKTFKSYSDTPTGAANPTTDVINKFEGGGVVPTDISFNTGDFELEQGSSKTIKVTFSPNGATGAITWSVSPESAGVTVNNGVVSATDSATKGQYTIRAELTSNSSIFKEVTCTVIDSNNSSETPTSEPNTPADNSDRKFDTKTIIIIASAIFGVIVVASILVVIFVGANKRGKKKMLKTGKKIVKKATKSSKKK